MSVREQLDKMTADDIHLLGPSDEIRIEQLARLRRQAINEHLEEMHKRPEIEKWAGTMTLLHGPKVKIHKSKPLSWQGALLVARYGEAPYHWPDAWSDDDVRRAVDRWQQMNDTPFGIVYIVQEID